MFFCRRRLSPPPPHHLTRNVKIKLRDIPQNQSHISRRPISAVSPIRSIEKTHRHVRPGATLWTKHPLYGQAMFALDRLGRCHRSTLGGKEKDPFNSVLRVTEKGRGSSLESDWLEIVAVTHAWTRRKSFRHSSNNGSRRQSSTTQSSIHRAVYQPMLEEIGISPRKRRRNVSKRLTAFKSSFTLAPPRKLTGLGSGSPRTSPDPTHGDSLREHLDCTD